MLNNFAQRRLWVYKGPTPAMDTGGKQSYTGLAVRMGLLGKLAPAQDTKGNLLGWL